MKATHSPNRHTGIFARLLRPLRFLSVLSLILAGCNSSVEDSVENTISFDRIADSLKLYDEVTIVLKSLAGDTVDVVYREKVEDAEDVKRLKAPNWDGGTVVVSITGIKDGKVVYQVDTRFDPATDTRDNIVVFVSPEAALTSTVQDLTLLLGDSLAHPPVSVTPSNILDKTLDWEANPAGFLVLGSGHLKAAQAGNGVLTASLRSNPSAKVSIPFTVAASGLVPESLTITPEILQVAAGGAPGIFSVEVSPSAASAAVLWTSEDISVATVDPDGRVHGKSQGETTISAVSRTRPSVKTGARVIVTGAITVEKVAFVFQSQDILVGAAESLLVIVTPPGANPAVSFSISDPSKATVQNGKITGTASGTVSIVAASVSNPNAKDTLIVNIKEPTPNDTVPPGKPTVRVNPAGPTRELRPTWTWTSGGGGAGAFQISLNKTVFDSSAVSLSDTLFRPAGDLSVGMHILYVRERDAAGNWSQAGQAQVEIDTAGPTAPKVLGTSPTSSLPHWTWSSGGGGGAGVFRFRLGDATFPADARESRDTTYSLTSATTGTTYTLFVQERDAAGNWSQTASHAIKYDLTKPTVTITLPQASGTFITAAETIRISGTSAGPNGMAAGEYTLDGGAPSPLTLGANGSWTIPSLPIPNAKTSIIKVIATDSLGNKGEAQISVLRDSDPPTPPASLSDPSSPTNVATASWTWAPGSDGTAGSGLSGKYRWKLNAGDWTEVTIAAATGITLVPGSNIFSVQEEDKAGNWSTAATSTVVLDNRPPDAVTFIGIDSGYTDDATPTWTWTPSTANGGIAEYLLKLNAGAEFTWTTTTYTPTTVLSDNAIHTLTVRQKDQVPGVVGAAKSFSYRVKVNPPGAPTVRSAMGTSFLNNGLTKNPGFTWTSGGGGNGKYRVRVNAETTYRINGVAQASYSILAGDPDGIYTLRVSEQDDLGRYGPEGTFTIRLDRTPPQFANARIAGKIFPLRDGFITNAASLAITYTSDGAAKSFTCALTDNAATVCRGAAQTDSALNSATFQINIWRRSKVVFFTPTGTGDGSSWEEAASDIQAQVETGDGKDFWLASGDYTAKNNSLTIWGITLNLIGGFFYSSYPTDTQDRNKGGSILAHISTMGTYGTWDGIQFVASSQGHGLGLAMGSANKPANIIDCQFKAGFEITLSAAINFQNCEMIGVSGRARPFMVNLNSVITWDGGAIRDNIASSGEPGITIAGGSSATFRGNLTISGNAPAFSTTQIYNDAALTIANTVTFPCADIQNGPNASGNCKGTPIKAGQ